MPQDEVSTENQQSATISCSTCREQIQSGAKKCRVCDSYQDWRRFLNMSSSVLALLVALVSVLSFAAPIAVNMLRKDGSNITITLQAVQGRRVYFMASNSGNRPGGVGDAKLTVQYGDHIENFDLYRTGEPPFIMPGASRQISYTLSNHQQQSIENSEPRPRNQTRFAIEAIEFDGARRTYTSDMSYEQLLSALEYRDPDE